MKSQVVMHCPICKQELAKMYRVVFRRYPATGMDHTAYIPIWVCETHEFSVEINRLPPLAKTLARESGLRTERDDVGHLAALLKEGEKLVRNKPRGCRPSKRTLGSASDY